MEQIRVTNDYDLFKTIKGNRSVEEKHLAEIIKSMQENYLVRPIDVNEKMEVIDGQHRLEACRATDNPVYYIIHIGWGINEVHALNAYQKNWGLTEYLDGYCNRGYKDYIEFREFKNQYYKLSWGVLLSFANNSKSRVSGDMSREFKEGYFKFHKKYAYQMAEQLMLIEPYYKGYSRSNFVSALSIALSNNEFDINLFLQKLAYQQTKMVDCTTTKQYVAIIESIYNYKKRGEPLRLWK